MKKYTLYLFALGFLTSCELVDPTDVVNPNLSEENLIGQPNSSATWLNGTQRQAAISMNALVATAEIASDNYVNTATFYNQFVDDLTIETTDSDINVANRAIGRLLETARFGYNTMHPNDPVASSADVAPFYFYEGLALLWGAEYFNEFPTSPNGPLTSREEMLQLAISSFSQSLLFSSNTESLLGLARAHYRLGNVTEAVSFADQAIAADPNFVFNAQFDPVNSTGTSPNNSFNFTKNFMQQAIFDRGTFDDLQPLPSLDFLDPKLYLITGTQDSPIAIFKIEEAHLIKAEAALSQGNIAGAQSIMQDIVALVNSRPTASFSDAAEDRTQNSPGSRPDTSAVIVNGREDLVLDRKSGNVTVPIISGTSATDEEIEGLSTEEEALSFLYRMRQEIFIAEGRRMIDLGITFVISEIEASQNENIGIGHPSTIADIPPFLAPIAGELDAFTYDQEAFVATITHDLNAIIAANRTSQYVCPFH